MQLVKGGEGPAVQGLAARSGLGLQNRQVAGIRQHVLMGLKAGKAALLQGNGLSRMFALLGTTLAREIFAFDVPETVTVVKPADQTRRRVSGNLSSLRVTLNTQFSTLGLYARGL